MAEPLKRFFGESIVRAIASDLRRAHPPLDVRRFVERSLDGLDRLELTGRAWQIADVMHDHLPRPFPLAAEILLASLGPELTRTDAFGLAPFQYLPHVFFVQKHGLDDFDAAMRLQYELTKRFSAESSIRAFLLKYPEETYARLVEWSRDDNAHIRRLVSEGTRPRLPWAPRLTAFQRDPRPVIALLERLKDDPERYVQRSVANSLNDISKDHPDLAVQVCRRWLVGCSDARAWVVRHALRSLARNGHAGALKVLGTGAKPEVRVTGVRLTPRAVRVGGEFRFSVDIASTAKTEQRLLINFVIHYVKANGATRPKIFRLRKLDLPAAARRELGSTVSFRDMTTRRHHSGRHRIDLVINGVTYALGDFEVRR